MKLRNKFAILLAMAGLILPAAANGQAPKRIVFEKGKTSATVNGTTGRYGATYVVRARSGQKLVINATPKAGVGVKVETNGRYGEAVLLREEHGGKFEVALEESGDYTIFIGPLGNNPVSFILTVAITKLADI